MVAQVAVEDKVVAVAVVVLLVLVGLQTQVMAVMAEAVFLPQLLELLLLVLVEEVAENETV
jgi:hypothetical protein